LITTNREHLDALPSNSTDLSFGNSVYKITFEERDEKPVFGHKYWFFLRDAVENVPEYVVNWDNFVQWVTSISLSGST
jgi:mRNA (guanine-N7-)-methyltransferase